jgi:hypothetical protein
MMDYGDGESPPLFFCANVPEILSPKHHEIQEFVQNYHISQIKFSIFTYSTAMSQMYYTCNMNFEIV